MENVECEFQEYYRFFKENTNQPKVLAKLFKTDSKCYIYDTGTSKVLECTELEYSILEKIITGRVDTIIELKNESTKDEYLEALINIKNAIEQEDILKAGSEFKFVSQGHYEELDEELNNKVQQIVLELTGKCNLRCSYCIYSDDYTERRNFNESDMTEDIAMKAIDYLNLHGDKEKGVAVTFYGGEPLLKFNLLKKCIEYAQKTIKDKELTFSLTTNLTLMTKDIAEYLASVDGLSITCSIDGPKDIHDSSRKDIHGIGSFDRAITGLKYVTDAFGDKAEESIGLSMVYNEPYSFEKLEEIQSFFEELDWLPEKISKNVTYPSVSNIDYDKVEERIQKDGKPLDHLEIWSQQRYLDNVKGLKNKEFFSKELVQETLVKIHHRAILVKYIKDYTLNGCCVPGARKIYVTTNGDFQICERIDGSPIIGNVYDGIDRNTIKTLLIDEYANKSLNYCKECWASRLCSMCYSMCFTNEHIDMKKKTFNCKYTQDNIENSLILYHKCLEINPKKLAYLNDIKIG